MKWHKFSEKLPGSEVNILVFDGLGFEDYSTDDRGDLIIPYDEDVPPYYELYWRWIYRKEILNKAKLLAMESLLSHDLSDEERNELNNLISGYRKEKDL